jgi:DNA-binding GntR family transcriptional regulator
MSTQVDVDAKFPLVTGDEDGVAGSRQSDLAWQVADQVRELIVLQRLLPGEKVRQAELAAELGVSRSPLREALRTLESEGLVQYAPNRGYLVTRLAASDMSEIYMMRQLLEAELILHMRRPTEDEIMALEESNAAMSRAIDSSSIAQILVANREFHFGIFAMSELALVRREIERLWQLSECYRAAYLWLPETKARIVGEHQGIMAALKSYDLELLSLLSAQHRRASENVVVSLLVGR